MTETSLQQQEPLYQDWRRQGQLRQGKLQGMFVKYWLCVWTNKVYLETPMSKPYMPQLPKLLVAANCLRTMLALKHST
jgi:hypothetical protein